MNTSRTDIGKTSSKARRRDVRQRYLSNVPTVVRQQILKDVIKHVRMRKREPNSYVAADDCNSSGMKLLLSILLTCEQIQSVNLNKEEDAE